MIPLLITIGVIATMLFGGAGVLKLLTTDYTPIIFGLILAIIILKKK